MPNLPKPAGAPTSPVAEDAKTDDFFRSAFARPDFVGWHCCGLIDASQLVPRKQDRQHSGLIDGYGNPYPELQRALEAASRELYDIATRNL